MFFSTTKSENKRAEWGGMGVAPVGGRMWGGKGEEGGYGANNVYPCMQMQK
jgi:hypothetical protein